VTYPNAAETGRGIYFRTTFYPDSEAVVVSGNFYLAGSSVENRLVNSAVTKSQLVGIKPERPS
jgi:hypothetical protein